MPNSYPYEVNGKLVTGNGSLFQFVPYQSVFIAKFDCTKILKTNPESASVQ